MSSDFNINREHAEKAGAQFWIKPASLGSAKFPEYPYMRDVCSSQDGKEICISCSGNFRNWLTDWLKENDIQYEVW